MSGFKFGIITRAKPIAGSLPMRSDEHVSAPHPAQFAPPPFMPADETLTPPPSRESTTATNLKKLKRILRKAEALRVAVRDDAFDDWIRRYLGNAATPREWTQSAALYENYLKWAKAYGNNRGDRALSTLELATETRFGILLRDAGFTKKRRASGWFYPLRIKRGA